jgi:hypothetical protein
MSWLAATQRASVCIVLASSFSIPAIADMGRAPTERGTYISGEGGYMLSEESDVSGYGISTSGLNFRNVFVSPEDGWFAGGMIGFAAPGPMIEGLWFTRIEAYAFFARAEDSTSTHASSPSSVSLASVEGATLVVAPDDTGRASVERENTELGLRFERDQSLGSTSSITWAIAPFVRWSNEKSHGNCRCARRSADVDTSLGGAMFTGEPEKWLTPGIAVVGRLGVGLYGFDADGTFRSSALLDFVPGINAFNAHVSDTESGVGFRGQLGAGLKFRLWSSGLLETYAEADYFSDMGTARLPSNTVTSEIRAANVSIDDTWELRTGARLTFALGNHP